MAIRSDGKSVSNSSAFSRSIVTIAYFIERCSCRLCTIFAIFLYVSAYIFARAKRKTMSAARSYVVACSKKASSADRTTLVGSWIMVLASIEIAARSSVPYGYISSMMSVKIDLKTLFCGVGTMLPILYKTMFAVMMNTVV